MAILELIRYSPRQLSVINGVVNWDAPQRIIQSLPQICWSDGGTWGEANLWAVELASEKDLKTVTRSMRHLTAYAKWLELESTHWWHFPQRAADRCLNRFRGELMRAMRAGEIASTSASQRISTLVRFYRWLQRSGLISTDWPMWSERIVGIQIKDRFGFDHTLRIASTDLAISGRPIVGGIRLEGGVLPVSSAARAEILDIADAEASHELALMLRTGFASGMRIGSITDLKEGTILGARTGPVPGWHSLSIGPKANPPVATKFGANGSPIIPSIVLDLLHDYLTSTRRLQRVALASKEDRQLVFLNRFGKPYHGANSRSVNVEMSRLRRASTSESLRGFHFHRTRATFATELMRVALSCMTVANAIEFVREACMHTRDATTLDYVRFVERTKAMAEAADAFTEAFFGLALAKKSDE